MARIILILTQDKNNESVKILQRELIVSNSQDKNCKIIVANLDEVKVRDKGIWVSNNFYSFIEISLVIKRTWGVAREKALKICQLLEKNQVKILNGCEFIAWTHSKIAQYRTLEKHEIISKTLCFDSAFLNTFTSENRQQKFAEIAKGITEKLSYPLVFKTSKGTRGSGVYLINSAEDLNQALDRFFTQLESYRQNLLDKQAEFNELKDGFLLQEKIATDEDNSLSTYLRLNIVAGKLQSVMQFQMQWKKGSSITDIPSVESKPIKVETLDPQQIANIITSCPYEADTIGIDVIYCKKENKYYLLEYNDGPAISLILKHASVYKLTCQDPAEKTVSDQCLNFAKAIALHAIAMSQTTLSCEQALDRYYPILSKL